MRHVHVCHFPNFEPMEEKVNEFRMISFLEINLNHFVFIIGLFWESHVSYTFEKVCLRIFFNVVYLHRSFHLIEFP